MVKNWFSPAYLTNNKIRVGSTVDLSTWGERSQMKEMNGKATKLQNCLVHFSWWRKSKGKESSNLELLFQLLILSKIEQKRMEALESGKRNSFSSACLRNNKTEGSIVSFSHPSFRLFSSRRNKRTPLL